MLLQTSFPPRRWAAGVSLFELYTGKIMFQGNSNNHMLKLIQEVRAPRSTPALFAAGDSFLLLRSADQGEDAA